MHIHKCFDIRIINRLCMELIWSPETASRAFIDTVGSCKNFKDSGAAELISALAAGWNTRVMVDTWSKGRSTATSIGLAIARSHTGGQHVCIVPDDQSRTEYMDAMRKSSMSPEVLIGQPEEVLRGLSVIDFLVVNSCKKNEEFDRLMRVANLSNSGGVIVCINLYGGNSLQWPGVVDSIWRRQLVRSVTLPVERGLHIVHIAGINRKTESRWIKHIDRQTGEENVIRIK